MGDPFSYLDEEDTPTSSAVDLSTDNSVDLNPDNMTLDELDALHADYEKQQSADMEKFARKDYPKELQDKALSTGAKVAVPLATGTAGGLVAEEAAANAPSLLRWLASVGGFTAGEAGGNAVVDPEANNDFSSLNLLKNPVTRNAGLSLAAKFGSGIFRYFKPNQEAAVVDAATKDGAVAGKLGGFGSDAERRALGGKLESTEPDFLNSRVMDKVDPNSANPLGDLADESGKRMDELFKQRDHIIKFSDSNNAPATLHNLEQFTKDKIDGLRTSGKNIRVNDDAMTAANKYIADNNLYNLSSEQLQAEIDKADDLLKQGGIYDSSKQAAAEKGKESAIQATADEQGLRYVRDYFDDVLKTRTNGALSPLNNEISALSTYKPVITNAERETRNLYQDQTGASNVPSSLKGMATDVATGGEAARESRRFANAVQKDSKLFDQIKKIRDLKTGRAQPSVGYRVGQQLSRPSMQMAAGNGLQQFFTNQAQADTGQPEDLMAQPMQDPFANGVPRDSNSFGTPAMLRLMQDMEQSAQVDPNQLNKMTIAKQLGMKLAESERTGDFKKKERIVADLAKLAPEHFEPGRGVNNKLFHPDDQQDYMEELERLHRAKKISSIFLAKQRNAFLDKNDAQILPLETEIQKTMDFTQNAGKKNYGDVPKENLFDVAGNTPLQPRTYDY